MKFFTPLVNIIKLSVGYLIGGLFFYVGLSICIGGAYICDFCGIKIEGVDTVSLYDDTNNE